MPTADLTPQFMADICAHPNNTEPRRIFADWLDDNGREDRSRFIRAQLELADTEPGHSGVHRADGTEYSCRVCTLRQDTHNLLSPERFWEWFGGVVPKIRRTPPKLFLSHFVGGGIQCDIGTYNTNDSEAARWRLIVRGGFVYSVRVPCRIWLENGCGMVQSQPITRVYLADKCASAPPGIEEGDSEEYGWWVAPPASTLRHDDFQLPEELFRRLWRGTPFYSHGRRRGPSDCTARFYVEPSDAEGDLSDACVGLARARAELPPLTLPADVFRSAQFNLSQARDAAVADAMRRN